MSDVGFAIVGCGNIAPFHAEALASISGARLVAVCDKNLANAARLGEQYGAEVFSDYSEMLKHPDVDVVNVCLPSSMHEQFSIEAARAGKHVVVEKPLDITVQKCDAIISACETNKVKLSVIFPVRFKESTLALKAAVNAGRFGKITMADVQVKWYRDQAYYDSGGWRGTWAFDGGGALMNQSIHYIDQLQDLMGGVDSVFAYCETLDRKIEVEDTAVAILKFKNGALGTIQGTTTVYPGLDTRLGIHGTEGSAILNGETVEVWEFKNKQPDDEQIKTKFTMTSSSGATDPTSSINCKGHRIQLEDMVEAINTNREPLVNGYEGRKSVSIISAIYQSAREKREIKL